MLVASPIERWWSNVDVVGTHTINHAIAFNGTTLKQELVVFKASIGPLPPSRQEFRSLILPLYFVLSLSIKKNVSK